MESHRMSFQPRPTRRPNTRPGFDWVPAIDMPTDPDSVWGDIIAVRPHAREFRTKPRSISELDRILSQTAATGSCVVYSEEVARHSRTILVDQRFRFIKLLATEPNAATMFYGIDDERRKYMVSQYVLADNSDLMTTGMYRLVTCTFHILINL
ncbi:hypothetical protein JG688_00017613 [Phytophthora aleatoria]|uniref:Uncharacterized protein n=1 Tax=Phytophthora aleatoria TaxID=2496075 RepID=A0A8J5IX00_9STRA|nr:hypothetical protein JG688_00017613 [Phytophthora aleatoria]